MILKINFQLVNIQDGGNDPYELKLFFSEEDKELAISEIHDQDFTFKLISDWQVSAFYTKSWNWFYIKGCKDKVLHKASSHHYNKSNNTSYHESEFNKELRSAFPEIENKRYDGEFNTETRVMKINN